MVSKIIILGGVPGVGKSTVCHELDKFGLVSVDFGRIMLNLAKQKGCRNPRWKMHSLPKKEIKSLETETVKVIMKTGRQVILESQIVVGTDKGFYDGFPKRIASALPITKVVLLEALPKEIKLRRETDPLRNARLPRYQINIDEHQTRNRKRAKELSIEYNIPLFVVANRQGELPKTVTRVVKNLLGDNLLP